jgi:aldehyde dehydrogenase
MNKPEFRTASRVPFAERYDNFIGGKFVAPCSGEYFDNVSPVTGKVVCKIARSDAAAVEAAIAVLERKGGGASLAGCAAVSILSCASCSGTRSCWSIWSVCS